MIDELNRSNFDRAFGQLFTVLSGQPVVLPFKRAGKTSPISIVPYGVEPPEDTDVIRVPPRWRIIATMNVFDKNLLFDMSYALMRRFAFIEVTLPGAEDASSELLDVPGGEVVRQLLPLRQFRDLGPACYLDACRYADRRRQRRPDARAGCSTRSSTASSCPSSRAWTRTGPRSCYKVVAVGARRRPSRPRPTAPSPRSSASTWRSESARALA